MRFTFPAKGRQLGRLPNFRERGSLRSHMLRWGFVGTGSICKTVARALRSIEAAGVPATLAAVASRTQAGADAFATEFSTAASPVRSHGSYEALFADPGIDVVYIGTPHPAHHGNALAALRAGKAVLCEKPLTMNAREAEELAAEARARNLFFMEAMWTRFLPMTLQVREWIAAGRIGEVGMLHANFGFPLEKRDPEGRLLNKALGGGSLLDLGIYPVSYAAMLFGNVPASVQSAAHIGETGVDEQAAIVLHYPGGKQALLACSLRTRLEAGATIYGTKGHIVLPQFFGGGEASLHVGGEPPIRFEQPLEHNYSGFEYELREVARCMAAGEIESAGITHRDSVEIMRLMDAIRKDWGVRYEADRTEA